MNGRVIVCAASASFAVVLLLGGEGGAQGLDGQYAGTIGCDALPAMRALKTAVTMTVAGDRARYEREILTPQGGPTGTFERGEGPVSPDGEARIATKATGQGYSYEAEYRGRIGDGAARLSGTQRWKMQRESGTIVRPCTLELKRSSS